MSGIVLPPPDLRLLTARDAIVAGLVAILGERHVISTADGRRPYETDAFVAYRALPLAVVLPSTTEEVAAVLKFLSEKRVKVVAAAPARRSPAAPSRPRIAWSSACRG